MNPVKLVLDVEQPNSCDRRQLVNRQLDQNVGFDAHRQTDDQGYCENPEVGQNGVYSLTAVHGLQTETVPDQEQEERPQTEHYQRMSVQAVGDAFPEA